MKKILLTVAIHLLVVACFAQSKIIKWDVHNNPSYEKFGGVICSQVDPWRCILASGAYVSGIQDIPLRSTHGCTDMSSGALELFATWNDGAAPGGSGFVIEYPFKAGFRYVVTVSGVLDDLRDTDRLPYVQIGFTNNPEYNPGTVCSRYYDVPGIDLSTRMPIQQITNRYGGTVSFDLTECTSYLWINILSNLHGPNGGYARFNLIQIEEIPLYTMDGPIGICPPLTSTTYNLNGLPPGASVCWSVSDPNIATISGPSCGTSVTLDKVRDGNVNLNATVTVCGVPFTTSKRVVVGSPHPFGTTVAVSNYNTYNGSLLSGFTFMIPGGQSGGATYSITDPLYTNISWTPISVPSGTSWSSSGNIVSMSVSAPGSPWTSRTCTIRMNATGPCGPFTMDFSTTAVNRGSSFSFMLSPNPAASEVTVASETTSAVYGVKITDQYGVVKKNQPFKQGTRNPRINIADLKPGVYMISVFDGKEWSSKSLLKQ